MRPANFWALISALTLFSSHLALAEQPALSLTVRVSGGTPSKGQVIISLFTTPANYLKAPVFTKTKPTNDKGEVSVNIDRLTAATYAVSAIYDEDTNGKLNTGFLGIPTEQVGFSNNAKGRFGPPSFEKTAFKLTASKTVHITLGRAKE